MTIAIFVDLFSWKPVLHLLHLRVNRGCRIVFYNKVMFSNFFSILVDAVTVRQARAL